MDKDNGRHFVLVHGACHGAWCWYKVATLLRSAGHRVTALDMAASGINSKKLDDLRCMADDFEPLMEFMAALPSEEEERVVLVGHSKGGIGMSLAMERFPEKIAVAVFVAAIMYGPNHNLLAVYQKFVQQHDSFMDNTFTYDNGPEKPPTSVVFGPKYLSSKVYQLSPSEDLTLATLLMRPVNFYGNGELLKGTVVTKEKYGRVGRVYIVSGGDTMMTEEFQRWMIDSDPTDEVLLISDADHMVMFSKPQHLSSSLQSIAEKWY